MAAPSYASLLCFAPFRSLGLARGFSLYLLLFVHRFFLSRLIHRFCVPTVLLISGTGLSTCSPSTTHFCLALGPDLPRADQLYSGNLGYSAGRILTFLSLLIPAFSLRYSPQLLSVLLRPVPNAPLPAIIRWFLGFGSVFQPRTFSAQDLSTSELLRTL